MAPAAPAAAGGCLTEALLLFSLGLVVNRHEGFFPSWEALFSTGDTGTPTCSTAAGGLDTELAARAAGRVDQPLTLPWQPSGWTDWGLATAPVLLVPAGYLDHPQWRYSVVLVVGDLPTAAPAGRHVVVRLRTTAGTSVPVLASELPAALHHDLRVTDHRWALVGSQTDSRLVRQAVLAAPGQFPAVATVSAGTDVVLPAGVATFTFRPADILRAVSWAADQTPPPLAASAPPVKSLPVHRAPPRKERSHGPRQPGR